MCLQILHGCLCFAARESADYLCGSSTEKCKLLVTFTVRLEFDLGRLVLHKDETKLHFKLGAYNHHCMIIPGQQKLKSLRTHDIFVTLVDNS